MRSAAQPLAPQLLGDYCLSLCLQGPATARYRGETHALRDATFQSYGAGEALAAAPSKGERWSYQTLRLSPELMHDLARTSGRRLPLFTAPVTGNRAVNRQLGTLFRDAFMSFEEAAPGPVQEEKLVALMRSLLAHQPVRPASVTPRAERAVEVAKAHLRDYVGAPLSLEQLASTRS